jgi:hypothetical protein
MLYWFLKSTFLEILVTNTPDTLPVDIYSLSFDKAKALARECTRGANSETEVKERLTEAGFDGAAAAVTSHRSGEMFMFMAMIHGPDGKTINISG